MSVVKAGKGTRGSSAVIGHLRATVQKAEQVNLEAKPLGKLDWLPSAE
jgi:hypothetical protein